MQIPFLDLSRQEAGLEDELKVAFERVMKSGRFILGPEVEAFEAEWAAFCGAAAAAAVGSGTDALALALKASGAVRSGSGDEVVTAALSSGYTALAILNAGAVPVFADIDPTTYTLDAAAVERAVTSRTRAIVPVHLYGRMADMRAICAVAEKHQLVVIEDAAQAHGASLEGRRPGEWGHAAAFSFYPTKNLGAYGDGGSVVSRDGALIERVKRLRQGGHPGVLSGSVEGRNSRFDEIQAACLRVKLKYLNAWNARRRDLARIYDEALGGEEHIRTPAAGPGGGHAHHLYVIQHPARDALRAHLAEQGVETMIHYPFLLHEQPLLRQPGQPALPVAEALGGRLLSLPLYPQLSFEEAQVVAEAILRFPAH